MKKRFEKILDKINYFLILGLPLMAAIVVFVNWYYSYKLRTNCSFNAYHLLIVILPIEVFIYFYNVVTRKIRMGILDLIVYFIVLIGLVVSATEISKDVSFWGSKLTFTSFSEIVSFCVLLLNSRILLNKEKFEKILDNVNYFIVLVLTILVPITFFINWFNIFQLHSNFTFKIHQFLTFVLPIEIFIYLYKLIHKKFKIGIFDILIYLLIIFGFIATETAIVPEVSMWGSKYRFEGLVQIITYYFLFLNSRQMAKKEIIVTFINNFIIMGIFQFIYSFLQVYVRGQYIYVKYDIVSYRASGFIGHPNMLGSFIVLILLISIGMYFLYNKNRKFYLISSILLYINLILTESTGPYFGFSIGLLFMIIFLLKKKKINWKQISVMLVTCIVLLVGVSNITRYVTEHRFHEKYAEGFSIQDDIYNVVETVTTLFSNDSDKLNIKGDDQLTDIERLGSARMWIWKRSLKLVPKYLWTGAGIDNFGPAFVQVDDRHVAYFDKAHNEYLQILITQGIFALLSYLALLIGVFIKGIKSKEPMVWILLFGFVGFAIQAFANISVYNVTPFFFIVMGLLVGFKEENEDY